MLNLEILYFLLIEIMLLYKLKEIVLLVFAVSLYAFELDEDVVVSGAYKTHAPFYKYESPTVTVTLSSAATGTGRTITASSDVWTADYVGHYIRVDGSQIKLQHIQVQQLLKELL